MADKHRIKVIIPIPGTEFNASVTQEIDRVLAPDFEFDLYNLQNGAPVIESRYDEFRDTQEIIEVSRRAEKDGYAAIFVDCFGEPGVSVVRELVDIPVVGGFWPAVATAAMIAQKYSIVSILPNVLPMIESLARDMGVAANITSLQSVDIPVMEMGNEDKLRQALQEQSRIAIDRFGAEAIVLGCTGMLGMADRVGAYLKEQGKPAPVVDPTSAAITLLQAMVRQGVSQSRLTYYTPADAS